jgi:tetratricopeptide (TPR) repeat protein
MYNLDYERALSFFESAVRANRDDPERWNHLGQAILHRSLFRGGALDSDIFTMNESFLKRPAVPMPPADEKRFVEAITTSLRLTQMRLRKDPRDRVALYAEGVAYAHRAQYFLLVKKANLDALRDGTRSRKAHNRLLELDSTMADAKLIPGMHEYVMGNLPKWVKALIFLAGFGGDKWKGIGYITDAVKSGQKTGVEARVLLSLIYSREKQPDKGLPLVKELIEAFPGNHLYRAEEALLLAAAGRQQAALSAVENLERLKREGNPHLRLLTAEGIARLRRAVEARAGKSKG